MNKFLFTMAISLCCFCISCNNNAGGPSEKAKKNLDAMHGVMNAFDTKDFSKIGDYIAEDAVDHAGDNGDIKGLANMKAQFEKWTATTGETKTETIKEMADDDYVMTWNRYTGTTKIDQMGLKAGDKMESTSIEVAKFKDGKAVEHWTFMTPAEMMKMMPQPAPSAMPAPAEPAKKDTTKKM